MAAREDSQSFQSILDAGRERKKHEELANEIFNRTKQPISSNKNKNKDTRSPSLASRVGVQKRSSSVTSTSSQKNPFSPPSRPSSTTPQYRQNVRTNRIANEIKEGTNVNISSKQPTRQNGASTSGFSIKGTAGPFVVEAKNFAPGTTEADIESALHTDLFDETGANCLQSCQIISTRPQVVAEMVFTEKIVADRIINKFDSMKADGRILRLHLARSGPGAVAQASPRKSEPVAPTIESAIDDTPGDDMEDVEITVDAPVAPGYENEREAADRDRRDRERDRDSYSSSRKDEKGRDGERSRDDRKRDERDRDRDRERVSERDRDNERNRDRDRDRDRNYERREPTERDRNQRPPPQFGNGPTGPRGGYGFGGSWGGRGSFGGPRGGYGGPRGGFGGRGSYGMR